MSNMRREKTQYPGVFYRMAERIVWPGMEKVFYIVFKRDGKTVETNAGRQYKDNMTAASAARLRAVMLEGKEFTRKEKRQAHEAATVAEAMRPTLSRLLEAYKASKPDRSWATDISLFGKYIAVFLEKTPCELFTADMDAVRTSMFKVGKSAQTVKHALALHTVWHQARHDTHA